MSLAKIREDEAVGDEEELAGLQAADEDFMATLLKQKKGEPSKFESYWEKDENDVAGWTDVSGLGHNL